MNKSSIDLCNKFLYYLIAPSLLLYFGMLDVGIISPSFIILIIFGLLIILGVTIPTIYKKKNKDYNFEVNKLYANTMAVLVIVELSYNFTK